MQDQIKITVIATGFRAEYIQNRALLAPSPAPVITPPAPAPAPAFLPENLSPPSPPAASPATAHAPEEDDLDVPAFLRLGNSALTGGN